MTKKLYKTRICRLDVAYGISTHIIIRDDIAVFNLIYKTRELNPQYHTSTDQWMNYPYKVRLKLMRLACINHNQRLI